MTQVEELCRKYDVIELGIFGSVLRDDFNAESDIDFLVRFKDDDTGPWMNKVTGLEGDLSTLLGRKVDVVTRKGVEASRNSIRRKDILDSTLIIYEA